MENQVPAAPKKNVMAVLGLVFGIVALVFAWIPVIQFLAWIFGPLAVVFGIIGVIGDKPKKGAAIAGIILGVLSIVSYYIAIRLYLGAAANAIMSM